ncbi:MBL fold metallo-hydrolase [Aliifodinibius sp. S!AR15-10]|uniref:MBL fold metallo-hydrolase n=1 Tax=Aliifodinibius sp. S!AR15-10 TaxID=2950437 RepID=UPI002860412D|nr:MBL fold metallo-hydrolase [Aliifodinibius sp. S!AR15-10]MDR8390810.1 MBL fold metallo-hydrolase [Aliifodinibius sp. S!AR15-10]
MKSEYYQFNLGDFECVSLLDGRFNYPLEAFFTNVPKEQLAETLRQHDLSTTQIATPYTCLFVNAGRHKVIIDTGAGNLGKAAEEIFPGLDHSTTFTGYLIQSMEAAGIDPADIDTVIFTHAHPDHIGGTLDGDGNPVFTNASYFIANSEWMFWTSDNAVEQTDPVFVDFARQNLHPVQDRLNLIEDGAEIVPGIQAIATPGHTPGHIALSISSNGHSLLHAADIVLYPLHLEHPDWLPAFDMSPKEAAISKRRIFDRAAEEKILVFAHHFPPFPNLGYVVKNRSGWQWQPIRPQS